MPVSEWPEQFVNQLPNLKIIEPLHGLSTNRVWHAVCEHGPIVVKASDSSVETRFYCELRSILSECAVTTPRLFATHSEDAKHWIAIEKVPHALPRERWLADAGVMGLLRNLHQSDLALAEGDWFRPKWTPIMTANTLSWYKESDQVALRPILNALQTAIQPLFEPTHLISGDPNPNNWGLRADGTLVLFDWERITQGHPALDIAITIPGLGCKADYLAASRAYLPTTATAKEITLLAQQLVPAKAWTVVELLSNALRQDTLPPAFVQQLGDMFSIWLLSIDS